AYWLGRSIGVTRFRCMRTRSVVRSIGGVKQTLKYYGALVVISAPHILGGDVAVNFIPVATRMRVITSLGLAFLSASLSAAYSTFIGYFTPGWLEHTVLQIALALVFAANLGLILDRAIKKFMRSRMERTPDQDDPEHQTGLDSNP